MHYFTSRCELSVILRSFRKICQFILVVVKVKGNGEFKRRLTLTFQLEFDCVENLLDLTQAWGILRKTRGVTPGMI